MVPRIKGILGNTRFEFLLSDMPLCYFYFFVLFFLPQNKFMTLYLICKQSGCEIFWDLIFQRDFVE